MSRRTTITRLVNGSSLWWSKCARINAAGRLERAMLAVELLTTAPATLGTWHPMKVARILRRGDAIGDRRVNAAAMQHHAPDWPPALSAWRGPTCSNEASCFQHKKRQPYEKGRSIRGRRTSFRVARKPQGAESVVRLLPPVERSKVERPGGGPGRKSMRPNKTQLWTGSKASADQSSPLGCDRAWPIIPKVSGCRNGTVH